MNNLVQDLHTLCSVTKEICDTAKKAKRNSHSLKSDCFYGNKFHGILVKLAQVEARLLPGLSAWQLPGRETEELRACLQRIRSPETPTLERDRTFKALEILVHSKLMTACQSPPPYPTPKTEQVLPLAVVKGTRGYIEKIATQANACYETRCYDACSVMVRRLVETLIIEMYEAKGKQSDIRNASGEYFMLSDLLAKTIQDTNWNLSRETKQGLPKVKTLGDRSAHNRRFVADKVDVDNIIGSLRVIVEDLLHLSGLK